MSRRGPPKHQNKTAWIPNAGHKINETEVGGKFRPYSEITGVCHRCKEQIDWKRRYGKYKPLSEPAKCQRCSKRAVRQAYHKLCPGCAKEHGICAKCCCRVDQIIGRDASEAEVEKKMLEEAIKNARERERRTLLRAMNQGKSNSTEKISTDKATVGKLFPNASLEDYAKVGRNRKDHELEDKFNIISLDKNEDETNDSDDPDEFESANEANEENKGVCNDEVDGSSDEDCGDNDNFDPRG